MDLKLLVQVYERQGETLAKLEHLTVLVQDQKQITDKQGHRIRRLELKWTRFVSVFTLIGSGLVAGLKFLTGRSDG